MSEAPSIYDYDTLAEFARFGQVYTDKSIEVPVSWGGSTWHRVSIYAGCAVTYEGEVSRVAGLRLDDLGNAVGIAYADGDFDMANLSFERVRANPSLGGPIPPAVPINPGLSRAKGWQPDWNPLTPYGAEVKTVDLGAPSTVAGEVRVTSSSGGQKGSKPAIFEAFPAGALMSIAEVYGFGAAKYDDVHNFRKGYDWSLSWSAMQRHLWAFWGGEDNDPESGLPHMAHAAWHCMTLLSFMTEHPDFDDRVTPMGAAS